MTNATWTTDSGQQIRVSASCNDHGYTYIQVPGGWHALIPNTQITRDNAVEDLS